VNTYERVVLIGFSGSGKSTVSRLLGDRLGWSVLDMDETLATRWNRTIPEIFQQHGEAAFRQSERTLLLEALSQKHVVISTGGGAVVEETIWADDLLKSSSTLVVSLDANPSTMLDRLTRSAEGRGSC
jgi:shikimate kinase